ncbi:MAG: phospho-N-acetylmuramoyl-pentapeptide-transferase [Alistipes sp.]|nr:phospho-N-acetylmuramoyl-pentapeptide-transferase [Alistipes sp.]MBQ3248354.1 phospho-N-acetylmuramoyl-pentapeptide-transferase [Alistipes sp.]
MLYRLFEYLNDNTDLPGMRIGEYISFRSAAAIILSLLIAIIIGKRIIRFLKRKQIGEDIRDLGLEGQLQKRGTPTMGGIIIIAAVVIPVLLFGDLENVYIQLMLISTLWLGFIGGLDDYIKVFRHKKEGLKGRFKIVGQVGLGIIVGTTMWLSEDIVIHEKTFETNNYTIIDNETGREVDSYTQRVVVSTTAEKSSKTSIPFLKDTELDYKIFTGGNDTLAWLLYIVVAIFVITAVSNGANLTDGIDGLLTGVSVPIVLVLGILAYLSGHIIYSDYLNIMYIPDSGELIVFAAAFAGALIGFLWYNSFPAQIFMGDTGSLTIGGIIAVFALCIRKELLLPLLCGVFLVEALSVMVQVGYFKYTKRKYGEGRRILLMSPIHHHYQKKGLFETKIMMRFFIVSLLLAALTLVTLKIQ